MPERVVDLLEAIEVEKQCSRDRPVAVCLRRNLFQPIREQHPVGKVREHVVQRLVTVGLHLATQVTGCPRHDSEHCEIQQREADGEREIEAPRVVIDCVRDRLVRQIDLECTDDLAVLVVGEVTVTIDAQRNVDRQQALM